LSTSNFIDTEQRAVFKCSISTSLFESPRNRSLFTATRLLVLLVFAFEIFLNGVSRFYEEENDILFKINLINSLV